MNCQISLLVNQIRRGWPTDHWCIVNRIDIDLNCIGVTQCATTGIAQIISGHRKRVGIDTDNIGVTGVAQ